MFEAFNRTGPPSFGSRHFSAKNNAEEWRKDVMGCLMGSNKDADFLRPILRLSGSNCGHPYGPPAQSRTPQLRSGAARRADALSPTEKMPVCLNHESDRVTHARPREIRMPDYDVIHQ